MKNCYRCGDEIHGSYYNHFFKSCKSNQPICQQCFEEVYWNEVLLDKHTIIVEGVAYYTTDNPKDGGYGGREFTIHILETDEIKKVGLWMNGKIPPEYFKKDTAKIIGN